MAQNKIEDLSHPVDRGWAWVIMIAAFVVHFFSMGFERSFGLLYVEFQDRFHCSSTLMSAVIGAKSIAYCLTTVLVMNLGLKKISVRTSCMIGCVFQSMSVVLSSFIANPVYLIGSQGIMFGVGHAMLYCPTLYLLSQYFNHYRSITTAIASCGSSIGGIAFPIITRRLLETFGLSGTLMMLGSMLMQQLVLMALYTPPEDYRIPYSSSQSSGSNSDYSEVTKANLVPRELQHFPPSGNSPPVIAISKTPDEREGERPFDLVKDSSIARGAEDVEPKPRSYSLNSPNEARTTSGGDPHQNVLGNSKRNNILSNSTNRLSQVKTGSPLLRNALLKNVTGSHSSLPYVRAGDQEHSKSYEILQSLSHSMNRVHQIHTSMPSLFHVGLTRSTRKQTKCKDEYEIHEHDTKEVDSLVTDDMIPDSSDINTGKSRLPVPAVMALPLFWVLLFYFIGGVIGTGFPPVYIPPLAQEKGLSRLDGAYFLIISASIEIVGRFLPGFILHFQFLQPSQYMVIPTSCLGVLYLLTPVFNDFLSLMWLTLAYGLMSSSFWAIQTLVVIEVLGMEHLASAIGFYAVFMGLSCSFAFPFGGWLKDSTGTYASTFMFLGVMYLVATASLLFVLALTRSGRRGVTPNAALSCSQGDEEDAIGIADQEDTGGRT